MHNGQHNKGRQVGEPPIDLTHLSRQTLGDTVLEQEVLGLFVEQAVTVRDALSNSDTQSRRQLAHSLVGSARAVGAFALANCAAAVEKAPFSPSLSERLGELVEEVRLFVHDRFEPPDPRSG
ncbi:Hpt domain-containing protein [Chelativorans sp. M5D2P16]|uniref:Hpt domain-containing protein n=1 Tax=Chelativorans sp. M5D2P16 TaxID=3095678 RepID=UPI002ACAC95E|nr:Hpt domain-containing protein [Chelativorans sp. M5D2P16]MDZ5696980.1 Hpt domain-containing protein [Chelativorans sp. M5D2P16]